jgi:hypothetical protein
MAEQPNDQMTKEQFQKAVEDRKKEFEDFLNELKSKPEESLTKKEFVKTLDFILEDFNLIAEMSYMANYNNDILGKNFEILVKNLTENSPAQVNKTKSGIILP